MLKRKAFQSIFNEQKYQYNLNTIPIKNIDKEELNISDCSSAAESEQENKPSQDSYHISISSDSDDYKHISLNDSIINKSFYKSQTVKCLPTQRRSVRRKRLPQVQIQRRSIVDDTVTPITRNKYLSVRNVNNNDCNSVTKNTHSPFKKVRKLFAETSKFAKTKNCTANAADESTLSDEDDLEKTIIWSSSDSESKCNSVETTQLIETPTTATQNSNSPTELDLLLSLIESETKQKQTIKTKTKRLRRYRKAGYLAQLYSILDAAKADNKFLEHDKKFELQSGTQLEVIELENSFEVHLAKVKILHNTASESSLYIVLDADMANKVQLGTKLEAFFNVDVEPYTINNRTDNKVIYIQPHKLLLLSAVCN